MASEHSIRRYRRWYSRLLRLYPRAYHERFAESMEQTFTDLLRDRVDERKGLFGFVLWTFLETSVAMIKQNLNSALTQNKSVPRIALGTGLILLIPVIGMLFSDGWHWGPLDFLIMGALLFGTGLTFDLISKQGGTLAYRVAAGIGCLAGLLLVWVNAAVGIIGDEDLANVMYLGVLIIGFLGAFLTRFEPRGMARALVATALAQFLVPLIAMTWVPEERFAPGYLPVIGLNAPFVAMFLVSALLFQRAATTTQSAGTTE